MTRLQVMCIAFTALLGLVPSFALSQQSQRFEVNGSKLFIDLDLNYYEDDWLGMDERSDYKVVIGLLFENPEIDTVVLTGLGGSSFQSLLIARALHERGLATVARDECVSACAVMFLGGVQRTIAKGGSLGFHRSKWNPINAKEVFDEWKEYQGWTNEFIFAIWLNKEGQIDAKDVLELSLDHGVSPRAVVKMLSADSDDIWRPTMSEMREYKIITSQ